MRKLFLIAMCLGWLPGSNLFGQQLFQYSLNMLNPFAANPAYAGLDHSLSATGVYRKQWVNLPGSPVSRHINVHLPLYYLQGGFGINVASDQAGIGKMNAASAAYNYQMPVGKSLLSLGVSGGWYQMSLDGRAIQTPEGIREPFLDHRDEILPTEIISAGTGTIDLGAYFQSESFEFGVSARNLLMGNLDYQSFSYLLQQHYTLLAVYKWDVSRNLTLKPSVFLKSDLTQHQVDFSALLEYNDNIFGGVSFRGYNSNSIDALVIFGGAKVSETLRVGYAYDLTLSGLKQVSNGSHEILVRYQLNKMIGAGRPPRIIYNPRTL